jgi:hypothetical protein
LTSTFMSHTHEVELGELGDLRNESSREPAGMGDLEAGGYVRAGHVSCVPPSGRQSHKRTPE